MTISHETIEKIRNSIDIVNFISEYVPDLKKVGKDFRANCPFHNDKKPSFYVSPQKNIFHCFGCQTGGDIFKFLMKYENISYPEAIRKIADRLGITVEEIDTDESSERKKLLEILKQTSVFYHKYLLESTIAEEARKYLKKRQINQKTIKNFMIGYAPENNKLIDEISEKYGKDLLIKAGVVSISQKNKKLYDHLYGRIVFPIYNISGNIIGFGGRIIPDRIPKEPIYLNTPDSPVYNKSNSLYGLFQSLETIRKTRKVILVEGYFDVLLTHQYGIENTVAPLGTSFTSNQAGILHKYADEIIIVFDSDDSGKKASIRTAEICLEQDIQCKIVLLPEGKDPDEFIISEGTDNFVNHLNKGIEPVEFKFNLCTQKYDIKKPEGKKLTVLEMFETIKKIKDHIIRHEMIRYLSEKLSIKEEILLMEYRMLNRRDSRNDQKENIKSHFSIRSAEEEIIWLCINYPELIEKVNPEDFEDEKCLRTIQLLKKMDNSYKFTDILDNLDSDSSSWLLNLSFEERNYTSPENVLKTLLEDINRKKIENRRKELEKEVVLMLEGIIPVEKKKFEEFDKLTKILKGIKTGGK